MRSCSVCVPSQEMMMKINRAIEAVATQTERKIKCPLCLHNTIIVYQDTRGHVKTKCNRCRKSVVIDVASMRRMSS